MGQTVGDLLIAVRSIIPDMPQTIVPPSTPTTASGGVGSLAAGTYYFVCTATNQYGETTASPSASYTVGVNGAVNVTVGVPYQATGINFYWGTQQGVYPYVISYANPPNPVTLGILGNVFDSGYPPAVNRAFLPDTDGPVAPAWLIYNWLRSGLRQAADISGGIYDATGVNTTNGVAAYQLLGDWKKLNFAWFDGWILGLGSKGDAFYRNKITALSGIVFTDLVSTNSIVEYYPACNRTAGATTTTAAYAATNTSFTCLNLGFFQLPYGLAQIGNEVIFYQNINGNQLTNCIRGMGGTSPVAGGIGTTVLELNGRFAGFRFPILPSVGSATSVLDCPPGWLAKIELFMESRYRETERRFKEAQELRQQFTQEMRTLAMSTNNLLGPRQVGENYVNEVYGSGARAGGGWLIP